MKQLLLTLLTVSLLLSFLACENEQKKNLATTPLSPSKTEAMTETVPSTETEPIDEKIERVEESLLDRFAKIPVANSSMTLDELRQICVDYVCLSVSFQWIPGQSYEYLTGSMDKEMVFTEGKLYGGIPYINKASGNLYRILEYYDKDTGVLDLSYFSNDNMVFGTACSGTTGWGWARVINSAKCGWTSGLNVKNGLIRVGPYVYDDRIDIYNKNEYDNKDCKDIAHENGEQVMYESYALMRKADCLVNNGHVRMVKEIPVVVRNEDGTVNGEKSYVIQCEQGLFNSSAIHDRVTASGRKFKIQGNDALQTSFAQLYDNGYIPHTFKEFLGTDPVEAGTATIGLNAPEASLADLQKCTVKTNYVLSDVFTVICDENGNEVFRFAKRMPYHFQKSITLIKALPSNAVAKYQDGNHTVKILCQLGNGELLCAYEGKLIK